MLWRHRACGSSYSGHSCAHLLLWSVLSRASVRDPHALSSAVVSMCRQWCNRPRAATAVAPGAASTNSHEPTGDGQRLPGCICVRVPLLAGMTCRVGNSPGHQSLRVCNCPQAQQGSTANHVARGGSKPVGLRHQPGFHPGQEFNVE